MTSFVITTRVWIEASDAEEALRKVKLNVRHAPGIQIAQQTAVVETDCR